MAEEIDESGFYRQDFSAASDWEIFNAQLEEAFQKLCINDDVCAEDDGTDVFNCVFDVKRETLVLHNAKVSIDYFFTIKPETSKTKHSTSVMINSMYKDMMAPKNTFGPPLIFGYSNKLHTISCAFGLQRFVVISPHESNNQYFSNPSEFCYLLSSVTVVAAEYYPTVPIFIQIYDAKYNLFLGVGMHATLRTNFDLVALKQSPTECRYLSGLLAIFKEKLPVNCTQAITVSVRHTYTLQTLQVQLAMNVPFLKPLLKNGQVKFEKEYLKTTKFIALPCGYFPDAATELFVVCNWIDTSENVIDSPLHTEFVPNKSSNCSMCQKVHAVSYLSTCLKDFSKLYQCKDRLGSFVGSSLNENAEDGHIANALQHITDYHYRPKNDSDILNTRRKISGPLNEAELREFLAYLFPDLYPDIKQHTSEGQQSSEQFDPHRIKSSPFDSLSSRLCCLLATCNAHFGGKNGVAQIWVSFIRELRFIWSVRLSIPGVATGFPDTRTCLLNQKLQMLNYCIERSKYRKYGNQSYDTESTDNFDDVFTQTLDDDEDEFYDCAEYAPEGRDKRMGDLILLDWNEPLFIPKTQDPVPKTEDELLADAEAMIKLGSGSEHNMQLMCSPLLSDMEAFKAANPKAKLEDFIRWYSPKDWEEDAEHPHSGKLSARMQVPGNTWQTVWQEAQPVPASKQKRLFDETTEAIKILTYLETRTIGEIYELCLISVLHAAVLKFKDILETYDVLDVFESQIEALLADVCYLSRDVQIIGQHDISFKEKTPSPEHIIAKLELLETQLYQFKCFELLISSKNSNSLVKIKQKFSEMIKNNNCCSIRSSAKRGNEKDTECNENELISLNCETKSKLAHNFYEQ
ncbi:rab3 GTPase-activating protein catalytic subunit isoform X2 [Eurosta solidaginis]|uniref:rab3 GTPase-activating protein catalytic subunit isoform X2 n=1 Tax=Eurosta solidaginis TaxID=178769 RepID=UPI003530CDB7